MTIRAVLASRFTAAALWLATLPLALFVLLRLGGVADSRARLFAFETLTLWLLLPAYAVLALAALSRRPVLTAIAAVVVVLHLWWVAPDLRWWPHHQPPIAGRPFTLVSANVRYSNPTPEDAIATLAAPEADVLVVVELTPSFASRLESSPAFEDLRHRLVVPEPERSAFGAAIYSRFPLDPGPKLPFADFPLVNATIHLPDGDVHLVAVHTRQPLAGGLSVLREQLRALAKLADGTTLPLVLAGDFNATRQHASFRALLSHELRDAHHERGRGFARSWPMDKPGPAFALLDHVLVTDDVAVRDVDELTVPGSDHRAIVSRLGLAQRPVSRSRSSPSGTKIGSRSASR
jgi:endonuclease/exonuclease/phosphatase (EEP) superfamily protein YafD